MIVRLNVPGLPPKKDGANSMWRKPSEAARLRALRQAAAVAMADGGHAVLEEPLCLSLRLFAPPAAGDLDNFITGVCDGLMAAHANSPVDASIWQDVPEAARPDRAIVFRDDHWVTRVQAERLPVGHEGQRYELEIAPIEERG